MGSPASSDDASAKISMGPYKERLGLWCRDLNVAHPISTQMDDHPGQEMYRWKHCLVPNCRELSVSLIQDERHWVRCCPSIRWRNTPHPKARRSAHTSVKAVPRHPSRCPLPRRRETPADARSRQETGNFATIP